MSFAGVSVIDDGILQEPSDVYSGTASASGYHLLVVKGYSRIKHTPIGTAFQSRHFMLGGYRWVLDIFPNGNCLESADFISLFLYLDEDEEVSQPVNVHFDFSFVDQVEEQAPALIRSTDENNFSSSKVWGHLDFMGREALEQSEHLKDDCFTIRCDIIITNPLAPLPLVEVPTSDMRDHFSKLLETEVGADVTFMAGGETFVAHRCVLAARSAVFMAELFGPMKEGATSTDNVIQIQDMEASVFRALLRFMYTDSLPETKEPGSMEVEEASVWLQHLLVAADRYDLQGLKSMCEHKLAKNIDLSSVTTMLALAAQQHCPGLKEACLEFLKVQSVTALQGIMATCDWELMSTTYPCVLNELIAKLASKV